MYSYQEDPEVFEAAYEEEVLGVITESYEPVWVDMEFDPSAPAFSTTATDYQDVYTAQLDEEYIFEDLAITTNWLAIEQSLLEEQAEETFEDLEELTEETELLFIDDEALEDLIDEEELELLINDEAYEELLEEDNMEVLEEQQEILVEEDTEEVLNDPSPRSRYRQAVAIAMSSVKDTGTQLTGSTGADGSVSSTASEGDGGFLRMQEGQSVGVQEFQAAEVGVEIVSSPFEVADQQEQQGQDEFMFEDGGTFT